jgi:outer membrane protein assembly factor BamB
MASRDAARLIQIAEEMFASSWGDDALNALAEIALQEGNYSRARACWERISRQLKSPAGTPLWLEFRGADPKVDWPVILDAIRTHTGPIARLAYADTDLDLAAIRARLAFVSILEGSLERAEIELAILEHLHPSARGRFGGRDTVLADVLREHLDAARQQSSTPRAPGWPTFAGANERTKTVASSIDVAGPAWPQPIEWSSRLEASIETARRAGLPRVRVAEEFNELLSYHPVLVDGLLLLTNESQVAAFDLNTGKPAFLESTPVIYPASDQAEPFRSKVRLSQAIGVPRFTATVQDHKLYARLGSPVTSRSAGEARGEGQLSSIVCLDLEKQGGLVQHIRPDDTKWSFEGPPVVDNTRMYVAMRYDDVRPQIHVACYETQSGRLVWRKFICASESMGRGNIDEITHNLLTLHCDALYLNTNLGAVAALSTLDGDIRWLRTYRRADLGERALHSLRDLNPCIYYEDMILVAPADTQSILALDAATGGLLWECPFLDDVVHLIGVGSGNLIASGNRLWWIDVYGGKAIARFPVQPSPSVRGYGRGTLAGDMVYWPTRTEVYVFGQRPKLDGTVAIPQRQPIMLSQRGIEGASGGNLLAAGDRLLVVSPDSIFAFGPGDPPQPQPGARLGTRSNHPGASYPHAERKPALQIRRGLRNTSHAAR